MPTPAEMVTSIETTLAQLYTKLHRTLAQKDRQAVLQDISMLEQSRDYWLSREAVGLNGAAGSSPRVADINLEGF